MSPRAKKIITIFAILVLGLGGGLIYFLKKGQIIPTAEVLKLAAQRFPSAKTYGWGFLNGGHYLNYINLLKQRYIAEGMQPDEAAAKAKAQADLDYSFIAEHFDRLEFGNTSYKIPGDLDLLNKFAADKGLSINFTHYYRSVDDYSTGWFKFGLYDLAYQCEENQAQNPGCNHEDLFMHYQDDVKLNSLRDVYPFWAPEQWPSVEDRLFIGLVDAQNYWADYTSDTRDKTGKVVDNKYGLYQPDPLHDPDLDLNISLGQFIPDYGLRNPTPTANIYFGLYEKFDQINFRAGSQNPPNVNWQGEWQFWNGSTWEIIEGVTDSTSSLSKSGQMTFSAPANWQRTTPFIPSHGQYIYPWWYIRFHVTDHGTIQPMAANLSGEDYEKFLGNKGKIGNNCNPVEGNLTVQDYLNHKTYPECSVLQIPGWSGIIADYKKYQSRAPLGAVDDYRVAMNYRSDYFYKILKNYLQSVITIDQRKNQPISPARVEFDSVRDDGADNRAGYTLGAVVPGGGSGDFKEYDAPRYEVESQADNKPGLRDKDLAKFLKKLNVGFEPLGKSVAFNPAGWETNGYGGDDSPEAAVDWVYKENAVEARQNKDRTLKMFAQIQRLHKLGKAVVINHEYEFAKFVPFDPNNEAQKQSLRDREQKFGVAGFYLMQEPSSDYYSLEFQEAQFFDAYGLWGDVLTDHLKNLWPKLIELDIGRPTGLIPSGYEAPIDPARNGFPEEKIINGTFILDQDTYTKDGQQLAYTVYARDYNKALVILKPTAGTQLGQNINDPAIAHSLPSIEGVAVYQDLKPSGATARYYQQGRDSISLQNASGAILLKSDEKIVSNPDLNHQIQSIDDGQIFIDIPPDTLESERQLLVKDSGDQIHLPGGYVSVGAIKSLRVFDGTQILDNVGLGKMLNLKMIYQEEDIAKLQEDSLEIFRCEANDCLALDTTHDKQNRQLLASADHLAYFVIAGLPALGSIPTPTPTATLSAGSTPTNTPNILTPTPTSVGGGTPQAGESNFTPTPTRRAEGKDTSSKKESELTKTGPAVLLPAAGIIIMAVLLLLL